MIHLFEKLQREEFLKSDMPILDLGSGNGKMSESFLKSGFQVVLVDKDPDALKEAKISFSQYENVNYIQEDITRFKIPQNQGGIMCRNVIPFLNIESARKVLSSAWNALVPGGFLYVTYFGHQDGWAGHREEMVFLDEQTAKSFIPAEPYFRSEDLGMGLTMKGTKKFWHIYHFLYLKN